MHIAVIAHTFKKETVVYLTTFLSDYIFSPVLVFWVFFFFTVHLCMLSLFSHVQLFATPWTIACQASLSLRFSRQEYWSGLPFPTLGDLPHPGTELKSPVGRWILYHWATQKTPWPSYLWVNEPCPKSWKRRPSSVHWCCHSFVFRRAKMGYIASYLC